MKSKTVLVKGAGDFASGSIRRLHMVGFNVIATELEKPLAVRRGVAFSEAVYESKKTIEGVTAKLTDFKSYSDVLGKGFVALLVDPDCEILKLQKFHAIIDARMLKKKNNTNISDAPVVIGLGPGFEAGRDCHAVVETLVGPNLGRVIYKGHAEPNTGIPKQHDLDLLKPEFRDLAINDLVFFAQGDGIFTTEREIGDKVKPGDLIGKTGDSEIISNASGVLRGLIRSNTPVRKRVKLIEIDPSGNHEQCFKIAPKANSMAGGVLEAVFYLLNKSNKLPETS